MPSCFICGRTRNHKSNVENITFHRFPSNEAVKNKCFILLTGLQFQAKDKFPEYATPSTKAPNVNINQPLLKVESSIRIDGIIPFNTSKPSTSCIKTDPSFSSPSSASFSIMRPSTNKKNVKASYLEASKPVESDTPNRLHLKRGITVLSSELLVKSKQLKVLRQTVRRQRLKIASMKDIISKLQ
ncbi:THAP domain-containing protein 3-like [Aphis craccivora]|uniref:THAP domain-containing protein 3-like n=1 Tax=Aphis craccivora TaxID=307492 RepID=A0A6G0Y1H5_APHCR|nr:THAP domain-containing protein 3-like [Aphis craccivora]